MPQQVPVDDVSHPTPPPPPSSSCKQQVVAVDDGANKHEQPIVAKSTSNETNTTTATNSSSTLQQRINASSNGTNSSNNTKINHDSNNPKPATKLNGLRNRIIQRPPPLILDKVSNFYDNDNSSNTQPTNNSQNNNNKNNDIKFSNNVYQNQQQKTATTNLPASNLTGAAEAITTQSINSGANHKFWASLNENASRNKALANARNGTATSETTSATHINNPSKELNGATDSIGADLIISHRNSTGTIATSRLVSSLSTRKRSYQEQCNNAHGTPTESNQQNEKQIPGIEHQLQQHQQPINNVTDEIQKQHDVSNDSTEPDEGVASSENDGGNLIGVDNPTSPALDQHHHLGEEIPTSATSSRPRSNNPFLDDDDDQPSNDFEAQQQSNSFLKRPASFIAATDRVSGIRRSSDLDDNTQQIVEEQFNELQLNDPYQPIYQHHHMHANPMDHSSYQRPEAVFVDQQAIQSLDQRDNHSIYQTKSVALQQQPQDKQQQHLKYHSIYGISNGCANRYQEGSISLDSESAICQPPPSATMHLPHWTEAIYELKYATLETSSVAGGAENGQFIYIIETGDIVLEIDHIKVSGFTLVEFVELIDSKQFHLRAVQTKHSHGLTIDLKNYLNLSFPKNSEDKQLQNLIRENIYRRTIPCTSRPPKPGEIDKIDYHFLSKEHFVEMNNKGMLLECGLYAGHYYGTMKPFCDLNSLSTYQSLNQKDVSDDIHQPWDANHPAVDLRIKKDASFVSHVNELNEHPLYENHESLKMHQQRHLHHHHQVSQSPLQQQGNNFETIASQNDIELESVIPLESTKQSSIVAVDSEALPPGWERVIDQTHGTYYIDHNTQRTQYERPYEIELTKGSMGFGFTLVETDNGLLLVRSVIPGGPAHLNGMIRPGDILISAVGVSVAGLQHTDIARLFSTFAVGDRVRLTFARSTYVLDDNLIPDEYLFSNGTNGDLAIAVNSNSYYNNYFNMTSQQSPHILVNQEFEFITVTLKRGDQGFGFTISDSIAGQRVKKIQNHEICSNLKQGDILTVLNGEDITKLSHKEVVEKLKRCPAGQDVTLTVKRKKRFRSKTPMAMHTDAMNEEYSLDSTPQRNCKTPSIDGLMLRRPFNYNSSEPSVARTLFPTQAVTTSNQSHVHPSFVTHPMNGLPPQASLVQNLPGNQTCSALPPRPQPIVPQPIYGVSQQELYFNHQQQPLPPLPSHINESDLNITQQFNRATSIPSSEGLVRDNMTNSVHASEASLQLPPKATRTNMNVLSQVNQYNNFMNNDKLIMMQMQQHRHHQMAPPPPLQHGADYQIPLYSNGEVLKNEIAQPQVPIKPAMNQFVPSLYQSNNFQNNYYANNEEISLQRAQYGGTSRDAQVVPMSDQFSFMHSIPQYRSQTPHEEQDEYEYHHVDLDRENTDSNWGIRLIGGAEVDRAISIGSIVFGGAASKNGKLKSGDEIISINGVNVVGATHQHVVELISACTNRSSLVIRRKKFAEACEVVLTRNMAEGFGFVIISSGNCALIGRIIEGSPADRCRQLHVRDRIIAVNGRYITPNMQHPEIVNMIKECGSTLRLRIIPIDCYTVELIKSAQNDNFGFSMRGGSEYDGTPLYILRVAPNGLARDLLNVGDQILEINNIPTVGMTHQQAATIIKYSDPIVKLKLRRNYVTPPSLLVDSPRALQKFNQVTAEMKTINPNATPNNFIGCDTNSVSSEAAGGGGGSTVHTTTATHVSHQPHQQQQHSSLMLEQADQSVSLGYNRNNNQSLPLYAT